MATIDIDKYVDLDEINDTAAQIEPELANATTPVKPCVKSILNNHEINLRELNEDDFKDPDTGEVDGMEMIAAKSINCIFAFIKVLQLHMSDKILLMKNNKLTDEWVQEYAKAQEQLLIKLLEQFSILEMVKRGTEWLIPVKDEKTDKLIPGACMLNMPKLKAQGLLDENGNPEVDPHKIAHTLKTRSDAIKLDGKIADENAKKNLSTIQEDGTDSSDGNESDTSLS
jgi:hypothetical protein